MLLLPGRQLAPLRRQCSVRGLEVAVAGGSARALAPEPRVVVLLLRVLLQLPLLVGAALAGIRLVVLRRGVVVLHLLQVRRRRGRRLVVRLPLGVLTEMHGVLLRVLLHVRLLMLRAISSVLLPSVPICPLRPLRGRALRLLREERARRRLGRPQMLPAPVLPGGLVRLPAAPAPPSRVLSPGAVAGAAAGAAHGAAVGAAALQQAHLLVRVVAAVPVCSTALR